MLLLLRSDPARGRSPAEISAELRTTPDSVAQRLESLVADGLVADAGDDGFRYAESALDGSVAELASCYSTHRVAVIETIFSVDREPDPVRSFADAFRVRRDPE